MLGMLRGSMSRETRSALSAYDRPSSRTASKSGTWQEKSTGNPSSPGPRGQ